MKKLNIVRIIDQFGWAYDFCGREMAKYSRHNIVNQRWNNVDLRGAHVVYMCGPNMAEARVNIPKMCFAHGIKFIAGYSGPTMLPYAGANAIVAISPSNYIWVNDNCPKNIPKVLISEGVDQDFFSYVEKQETGFNVGWVGRQHSVKRFHITNHLKYCVSAKSDWGNEFFVKDRSLEPMREWYKGVDCLVVTSSSECCPRSVLEAMSCGIPVISTDVGFVKMFIGKDWIVPVNPEEVVINEMNNKLDMLFSDLELRKRVGMNNRQMVEKYLGWRKLQPLWDDMFEAVYDNNISLLNKITDIFKKKYKYLRIY